MGEHQSVSVSGGGCFGCLGTIAFFMVVWALIFGVTIGGVHHSLSCSKDKGVAIRQVAEDEAVKGEENNTNSTSPSSDTLVPIEPGETVIYEQAPPRYEHVPTTEQVATP